MKRNFYIKFLLIFVLTFTTLITKAQVFTIFSEDWTSNSFATNGWTFPAGQSNWTMGTQYTPTGGVAPNAFYNWTPSVTNYSFECVSPVINASGYSGGSVTLDYLLQLNNFSTSTLEQMSVEFKSTSSATWTVLTNYTNTL